MATANTYRGIDRPCFGRAERTSPRERRESVARDPISDEARAAGRIKRCEELAPSNDANARRLRRRSTLDDVDVLDVEPEELRHHVPLNLDLSHERQTARLPRSLLFRLIWVQPLLGHDLGLDTDGGTVRRVNDDVRLHVERPLETRRTHQLVVVLETVDELKEAPVARRLD